MQMSEHQHGKLERGRESEQKPFNQPLNKKKNAGASDWVKRKLNQHIRNKHRKLESQDLTQLRASNIPESHYLEEDNPLRRTASEPILKLRPKRSASGRQNPLQRKTSAPPAVRASDSMGGASSSTPVSLKSSAADTKMSHQEPQTYSTSSPQRDESPVHTMLWTRYEQPVFALHPPVLAVPGQWAVMSHKPLSKSQSAPSFFQHIHTQTVMITHPMYQQQWPQETFQQHTNVHLHANTQSPFSHAHCNVPFHTVRPVSSGSLRKDRERTREDLHILSQSPHDDRCSNQLGVPQHSECCDVRKKIYHRNLTRVHSSPGTFNRSLPLHLSSPLARDVRSTPNYRTGLVFDYQMLKHECDCKDTSFDPGYAGRIMSVWSRLQECGFRNQCKLVKGRPATFEELLSVHSEQLIHSYAGFSERTSSIPYKSQTDHDMVLNNSCSAAILKMSVGSVIELAFRVAGGELRNGFAVVTPPGHHASHSQTYGSSIFNSVAIAAKQLQEQLKVTKILIVDWDVHHGNGTEEIFYTDPSVLYISLHRYDNGSFFLGNGQPTRVGSDRGKGYNVNVAWSGGLNPPMGDAEYLAAFRTVVMPIAHEFSPDVVLVSAGFDAAEGHPEALSGYRVSANCFGFLTRKLMELAEGRVVLVLEGGYNLASLCDALQACVSALMGNEPEPLDEEELVRKPCINAVESLKTVLHVQSRYWHSVRSMVNTVSLSYVNAERRYSAGSEAALVLNGLHMTVPSSRSSLNEPMEHDEADSL
ncbi:histone deacetylase 7-like [Sinocyclocheilus rhinocerous]|uniref:histone deacetylase 7-like n=1 Tax=Sinocyclocheilus rhinocerous TaxID=307959 RepID=UPI0007BA792D|nr:PREDICTED: histone deacetylase 7-like [Sinocyclocheilus rhinocerous]